MGADLASTVYRISKRALWKIDRSSLPRGITQARAAERSGLLRHSHACTTNETSFPGRLVGAACVVSESLNAQQAQTKVL
jgi:hypothetical protein